MSLSRSRNKFVQYAKPSTAPRQGTAELFFDINNHGYPTVYYPDGTTQPLVADITIDGETLVIGTRINEVYTNYCADTHQGNGFFQKQGFFCDRSNGRLYFYNLGWYYNGCKYTISGSLSVTPEYVNGLNYVYFVGDVLTVSNNPTTVNGVMVCTVYKLSNSLYLCGNEMHNTFFDSSKITGSWRRGQEFNHIKIIEGFDISGTFNINGGVFLCDDIEIDYSSPSFDCEYLCFAQEYSSAGQSYHNYVDYTLRSVPYKTDNNNYVQYFAPGDPSGSWTTLTDNYYTSYIVLLTNNVETSGPTDIILLSYNEGIQSSSLADFDDFTIHIPFDKLRYSCPLYRILVDKNGNILRKQDLRGIDLSTNCKQSFNSEITKRVVCDYTRTDSDSRYDIINYMATTGDYTTSLAVIADGSASCGLFVSGEVDALMPMAKITNDGAGTSLEVTNTDGGLAFKADGRTALGIETISAGATIVPTGNKPIIKVTSDSSSQDNLITMPSGVAGQILTIINLDEDPITSGGNVYIPSGEAQQYIYVDSTVGWIPLGYGQVVSAVVQS